MEFFKKISTKSTPQDCILPKNANSLFPTFNRLKILKSRCDRTLIVVDRFDSNFEPSPRTEPKIKAVPLWTTISLIDYTSRRTVIKLILLENGILNFWF